MADRHQDVPTSGRRWPIIIVVLVALGFAVIGYWWLAGGPGPSSNTLATAEPAGVNTTSTNNGTAAGTTTGTSTNQNEVTRPGMANGAPQGSTNGINPVTGTRGHVNNGPIGENGVYNGLPNMVNGPNSANGKATGDGGDNNSQPSMGTTNGAAPQAGGTH